MTSDRLQLDQILRELSSYLQLSCSTFNIERIEYNTLPIYCIPILSVSLSDPMTDPIRHGRASRQPSRSLPVPQPTRVSLNQALS